MEQFKDYIEKLHKKVCEKPKNDLEKGFQCAVMLVYHVYKVSEGIKTQKPMTLEELKEWLKQ